MNVVKHLGCSSFFKSDYILGGSSHLVSEFLTPIISGLTLLIPLITGVKTHLLSGMSHQVASSFASFREDKINSLSENLSNKELAHPRDIA